MDSSKNKEAKWAGSQLTNGEPKTNKEKINLFFLLRVFAPVFLVSIFVLALPLRGAVIGLFLTTLFTAPRQDVSLPLPFAIKRTETFSRAILRQNGPRAMYPGGI